MWVISTACWGDLYRNKFVHVALPSLNAAIKYANISAQFIIYTDDERALSNARFCGNVEFRSVDHAREGDTYKTYGRADAATLRDAEEGSKIAFIPSDVIVNVEFFSSAENQIAQGKRCIVGSAARTLAAPEDCPAGLPARKLLDWSFSRERRHPVTEGCMWGTGKNWVAWMTYFPGPHGIVGRGFHLHPLVVVNDKYLWFDRETIDLDLIDRFTQDEIYVAVDPDEFAFAEISGLEKVIPQLPQPISVISIANWAKHFATPMQRWLFTHRIVVQGTGEDHLDEATSDDILALLKAMG